MKKKLSIALLAFSLAMLCANFLVRRVGSFLPPPPQETEEEKGFFPFALVKQDTKNTEENIAEAKPEQTVLITQDLENFNEKEIIKPILKIEVTEEE